MLTMHWNAKENRYAVFCRMWEGSKLGRSCAGRHETVENGGILWGWRTQAEFMQDTNEAFEAAIYGHYFANVEVN